MNRQLTESDTDFMHLIEREWKNEVTPDEREYLKARFDEWRAVLVLKLKETEGRIASLQNEYDQTQMRCLTIGKEETANAWYKYKAEKEAQLAKTRGFAHVMQSKLSELKIYKAQLAPPKVIIDEGQSTETLKKKGFTQGWSDCSNYFYLLMQEGYTLEEAYLKSMAFWHTRIKEWQKSTQTMKEKPLPIRGEDL